MLHLHGNELAYMIYKAGATKTLHTKKIDKYVSSPQKTCTIQVKGDKERQREGWRRLDRERGECLI